MTTSEQHIRFEEKIQELRANQGKNLKMFSNKEYHDYIKILLWKLYNKTLQMLQSWS